MSEGRKNDKIFIIGRGEAKIFKQMTIVNDKGEGVTKSMEILYVR